MRFLAPRSRGTCLNVSFFAPQARTIFWGEVSGNALDPGCCLCDSILCYCRLAIQLASAHPLRPRLADPAKYSDLLTLLPAYFGHALPRFLKVARPPSLSLASLSNPAVSPCRRCHLFCWLPRRSFPLSQHTSPTPHILFPLIFNCFRMLSYNFL